MIRDLPRLSSTLFDLLIVGGGIYGLSAAYDAAQRGLAVALVERGDFGGATSFNHLKTIHGGLRYLQTADVRRMREAIRERRAFARIAPRFVAPLPFVMPTSPTLTRNPLAMRAALAIDAVIASDRNRGLEPRLHLPPGRLVPASECRTFFEGLETGHLGAGAMWYDYEAVHNDRLTLAFALGAAEGGAVLANYAEALGPVKDHDGVKRIPARDVRTNAGFEVRARLVVNAAGPWVSSLLAQSGVTRSWPLLKAMNLVTSRPARPAALVAPAKSGRAFVLLPWQGRSLVGTSESAREHAPDDRGADSGEVASFLAEVNEAFRGLDLDASEVTLVHRGIVPAAKRDRRLTLLGHSQIIDHAQDGLPGVMSIVGVKYTTARAVAQQAVDLILKKLRRPAVACRTAELELPTAGIEDAPAGDPMRRAIDVEMAQTLADVVIRRTGVGAAGYPGDELVARYGSSMQQILGWSADRTASEIAAVKNFYEIG
ncbi:MAG TPA: FAD-dependent oxidoreductase [Vicinamibacterales bacterium]|nr:FAD-dependent oxidoreductase [Vicinamibacterales bacterium]